MDRWGRLEASDRLDSGKPALLVPPPLVSVHHLLRLPVVNGRRQPVGQVVDLVLDAELGTIAYAVVCVRTSGKPKRFAVPWVTLRPDVAGAWIVWDVERQALERSPGLPDGALNPAPSEVGPWGVESCGAGECGNL